MTDGGGSGSADTTGGDETSGETTSGSTTGGTSGGSTAGGSSTGGSSTGGSSTGGSSTGDEDDFVSIPDVAGCTVTYSHEDYEDSDDTYTQVTVYDDEEREVSVTTTRYARALETGTLLTLIDTETTSYAGDCLIAYEESTALPTGEVYESYEVSAICDAFGHSLFREIEGTEDWGDTTYEYELHFDWVYEDGLPTEREISYFYPTGDPYYYTETASFEHDEDGNLTTMLVLWDPFSADLGTVPRNVLTTQEIHGCGLLNWQDKDVGVDGEIEESYDWERDARGTKISYTQIKLDALTYYETYETDETEWARSTLTLRDIDIDGSLDYRFVYEYDSDTWPYDYTIHVYKVEDGSLAALHTNSIVCD